MLYCFSKEEFYISKLSKANLAMVLDYVQHKNMKVELDEDFYFIYNKFI